MIREELVFVATCDISGLARGKGFPARELPARLKKGVGWTGSNLMMSPFGPIWDTPFGTAGDFMIVPDPAAEVRVDFADGSAIEHFFLGDICNTDGSPWECCPRRFPAPRRQRARRVGELRLVAAFEQEFLYTGVSERPGDAYALGAFRRQDGFGETFTAALRAAGVVPDTFLAEYGPRQFEVTVMPQPALTAADHAVDHARDGARHCASAGPSRDLLAEARSRTRRQRRAHPYELRRRRGPAGDPRPRRADGAQQAGEAFLRRRVAPYARDLRDHRALAGFLSSADAQCLGADRDRPGAPGPRRHSAHLPDLRCRDAERDVARQFHVEFRATDAAASPYLALGAVIFAGVDGIRRGLELPTSGPPEHLPHSLPEALDRLAASETVAGWFGPTHFDAYMRFKRVEAEKMAGLSPAELCARYAEVY